MEIRYQRHNRRGTDYLDLTHRIHISIFYIYAQASQTACFNSSFIDLDDWRQVLIRIAESWLRHLKKSGTALDYITPPLNILQRHTREATRRRHAISYA